MGRLNLKLAADSSLCSDITNPLEGGIWKEPKWLKWRSKIQRTAPKCSGTILTGEGFIFFAPNGHISREPAGLSRRGPDFSQIHGWGFWCTPTSQFTLFEFTYREQNPTESKKTLRDAYFKDLHKVSWTSIALKPHSSTFMI